MNGCRNIFMTKSSEKNVLDVVVDQVIADGLATDRATAPGHNSSELIYQLTKYNNGEAFFPANTTQQCWNYMSLVMRKPAFCICENKDADQRLCFRYKDRTVPILPKSEISSL